MGASDAGHDPGRHWEGVAGEWTDWARAPGNDAYWSYRDAFWEFLPAPGAATLDIGCGEGRVARDLVSLGHHVTACDISPSMLAAARAASSAHGYVVADAACLPFADRRFDRVVAYNMLMDVPDVPAAVREASRVLTRDGVLTVSIVHPFIDRGGFSGPEPDASFVVQGPYFGSRHMMDREERDGHTMHFAWWSRPLEDYVRALREGGLAIVDLREPRPEHAARRRSPFDQWDRLPLFLWINAVPTV